MMFDRKFLGVVIAIQLLLGLPFLFGLWIGRSPELSYTGAHALTPGDYAVYLNYIEQGKEGAVAFANFYTTEEFPKIFNPFWFLVGVTAAAASIPPALAYHGFRVGLGMILLLLLWGWSGQFFRPRQQRWVFFALLFAGGVGTFYNAFISQSQNFLGYYDAAMDLWVPEAFGFLLLGNSPHIIASVILMVLSFGWFVWALDRNAWKFSIASGLASLTLFSFHPFHVPLVWGVELGALVLWWGVRRTIRWREAKLALLSWMLALPGVAYHVFLMMSNEAVRERAGQNLLFTPALPLWVASFGVFGLLGVVGAVMAWRKARTSLSWMLMLVWLVLQPFFFYSPLDWQRRMTQGWFIPLAFFGVFAVEKLARWWLRGGFRLARKVEMGLLAFLLLYFSPAYVWLFDFHYLNQSATEQQGQSRSFFVSDERELLRALRRETDEQDVILADLLFSNLLPGVINRRVFVGHGVETLNFQTKINQSLTFYQRREPDPGLWIFLEQQGITVVVLRVKEDHEHPLFNDRPHLVFENETFRVWKR